MFVGLSPLPAARKVLPATNAPDSPPALLGDISGSCACVGMVVVVMGFTTTLSTAFISSPRNIPA